MRPLLVSLAVTASVWFSACGGSAVPTRSLTARQALTQSAEILEFEPVQARQDLFREVARISQLEAGRETQDPVLFPIILDGRMVAAPALDARADLLGSPDAGQPHQLNFDGSEGWPEDRRESLQGLSEREAAELVSRTLLTWWGIDTSTDILVDRASGAPYAAAYVDGILRVNPSLLYLAASIGSTSVQPSVQ
ncbi:MAG: hypothetical protein WBV82_17420 [Myxococcaceae bacterium]